MVENLKRKFDFLKEKWMSECSFYSDPNSLYGNEHYVSIINLGSEVVPILIKDLNENDGDWFYALYKITGIYPVLNEHEGNFDKMREDWNSWFTKINRN